MEGISGDLIHAADPGDSVLYVIVFRSDALFATGSADIIATDTFDGVVRLVNETFPAARLQLRGEDTDAGKEFNRRVELVIRPAA